MTHLVCVSLLGLMIAQEPGKAARPDELPNMPAFKEPGAEIVQIGRNVWWDKNRESRRVLVRATVCRQEAILEEFMCLKQTKEHESILSADIVPKVFHATLLATGAKPGSVATFDPEFKPPTGDKLEITVEWKEGKETKRAKAQDWIRDVMTKKPIEHDFVFAGSQEIKNPVTGQTYYLGNEGDLISVANFASSVIDLAVRSSNTDEFRTFEAFKERIPPVDTEVIVILKPVSQRRRTKL